MKVVEINSNTPPAKSRRSKALKIASEVGSTGFTFLRPSHFDPFHNLIWAESLNYFKNKICRLYNDYDELIIILFFKSIK